MGSLVLQPFLIRLLPSFSATKPYHTPAGIASTIPKQFRAGIVLRTAVPTGLPIKNRPGGNVVPNELRYRRICSSPPDDGEQYGSASSKKPHGLLPGVSTDFNSRAAPPVLCAGHARCLIVYPNSVIAKARAIALHAGGVLARPRADALDVMARAA